MTPYSRLPGLTPACICVLSLLLFGCGDSTSYPPGWPLPSNKLTTGGCPDITGTYLFGRIDPDYDATTFDVLSTFLGRGVTQLASAPLLSFSVAGNPSTSVSITFSRTSSPRSESGKAAEVQTVTATYGGAYTCDGGWLVGTPQDLHVSTLRHDLHRGSGPSYRSGTMGLQRVRVRRDSEGGLVARTSVREPRVFSLWAETGAGIPYWFDTHTYWARWQPINEPAEQSKINPATLNKITRQEYEMENGVGAYSAAPASPKPAAPVDMRNAVARHIDSNATVVDVRREADRYVITLHVTARGQVTRTIENLSADPAFTDLQDHGSIASSNQKDLATLSLKLR